MNNDAKNFIFNDGIHCDYKNFFWVYDGYIEFFLSDDFFIENFFEIINVYEKISFNNDVYTIKSSENKKIRERIGDLKKNENVVVHVYK